MHPIFSSSKTFAVVSVLWLILSALITALLQSHSQLTIPISQALSLYLPWLFIFLFFCLSNYYICLRFPKDGTNFANAILVQIISAASTIILWLLLGYVWVVLLHWAGQPNWQPLLLSQRASIITIAAILYCFWVMSHYIYLMTQISEAVERDALQKKLIINQVELQMVKATTHPHFLYNALNTVANLSLVNPEKVHNLCLQITDFLRYSVNYSQNKNVTVSDELGHIQNYLGIERERFGERLKVEFNVDETARTISVIPLLLFPLIENAIKHGIDSLLEGGTIRVDIKNEHEGVNITVSNPYDPIGVKASSTKLGLSALKKRITANYGAASRLMITRENNQFQAQLLIPHGE